MAGDRPDLQDLVENPIERIDVELKDWIDIANDDVARANIARHLAALANSGGGYLLFGFRDDRSPNPSSPYPTKTFERDTISSIVKKYLTPTFQCEVDFITSRAGTTHPVVWVPSHGAVPVCSKADGPHDAKGRPQGIKMGIYYTRATGPESVPINTPELWESLIRRCVVYERTTLVGMFDSLLRTPPPPSPTEALKRWHERADARCVELIRERAPASSALHSRVKLSYAIRTSDGQTLDPSRLIELLREVNRELHDLVATPLLFYPYTLQDLAPYFVQDFESGQGDRDILECVVFHDTPLINRRTDFWRVSLDGLATHICPLWEDREDLREHSKREPGTWFCPFYLVGFLAQFVRHARSLATKFEAASSVEFRCEWHGLANREVFDPRADWFPGKIARANDRVTVGEWPPADLVLWPKL